MWQANMNVRRFLRAAAKRDKLRVRQFLAETPEIINARDGFMGCVLLACMGSWGVCCSHAWVHGVCAACMHGYLLDVTRQQLLGDALGCQERRHWHAGRAGHCHHQLEHQELRRLHATASRMPAQPRGRRHAASGLWRKGKRDRQCRPPAKRSRTFQASCACCTQDAEPDDAGGASAGHRAVGVAVGGTAIAAKQPASLGHIRPSIAYGARAARIV